MTTPTPTLTTPKRKITPQDIAALQDLLSTTNAKLLSPSDPEISASTARWSKAAEKPAGLSLIPSTPQEIGLALKYATAHGLDVAVKGGGHSTAGASSTDGGLLIDLRAGMNKVTVDAEKQLLHVQGGAVWGDVDAAAWESGLATVGGTVADTGVGGLTLGGGYGVLSGERGLVVDNMVGATVVLASGEVVYASEDENEDLFWALRGAGQNFGVTVEFVLQAHPQGECFMGMLVYEPTARNVGALVRAVNELHGIRQGAEGPWTKAGGRTMSLLGVLKPPPAGGKTMLLVLVSCNTDEATGRELYKDFLEIGPVMNTLAMGPYPQINKQVPAVAGMRVSMKGSACVLPLREEFVNSILATFEKFTSECEDAKETLVAWELYDPCVVAAKENGSFANRGYHLNSLIMPTWSKAESDAFCRQWARDVSNMFKEEIEAHGKTASEGIEGGASVRGNKGAVLLYGNYDVSDVSRWIGRECESLLMCLASNTTRDREIFSERTTIDSRRSKQSTIRRTCSISSSPSRLLRSFRYTGLGSLSLLELLYQIVAAGFLAAYLVQETLSLSTARSPSFWFRHSDLTSPVKTPQAHLSISLSDVCALPAACRRVDSK